MADSQPQPGTGLEAEGLAHTRLLQEELLARIEARLAQEPRAVELQVERAHLLAELKRPQEGAAAYREAVKIRAPRYPVTTRAYSILPYTGKTLPISVLLLVAPEWGNAPFRRYLESQIFLTLQVIADFADPGLPLPPHQLVINGISDADACGESLRAATALLAGNSAPVINRPAQVRATDRESSARRLGAIAGVTTPRIALFPRAFLAGGDAAQALARHGFAFPMLLRSPGYHTGLHFVRVDAPSDLAAALRDLPGEQLCVLEHLDARSPDGRFRKYRVMMIDGNFYPAHLAISHDWKVHYFSAAMAESPEHRAEDRAFLENMPGVLGPRAMQALGAIRDALQLDYAGIDFSLGADGEILLFEANATMSVQPPEPGEIWAYRRPAVQKIADAVRVMFFTRAFSSSNAANVSPTLVLREFTLRRIESALAREPGRIDLQIERARLLIELERLDEAKEIYIAILTQDATQVVALNNLATLLNMQSFYEAALKIYRQLVVLCPDNPKARVNLAHSLRESGELEEARGHYEEVLRLVPDLKEAHLGLGYVLMYLGEKDAAWTHEKQSASSRAPKVFSRAGEKNLKRVVILAAPCGGNSPVAGLLDSKLFDSLRVIVDFYDPALPLPPHDLVINAIGDADLCAPSLPVAERILAQTTGPVINPPARIWGTGRAENARLLGGIEGVVTPKIATLPRELLSGPGAMAALAERGLAFPLLLRSPGFHGGTYFVRVETPDALAPAVAPLPGRQLMAIEYLDARDEDGKIRKYRVMLVGGKLYPLHKAVSREWMIHYYSAEMAHSAEHRAEDAAFLEDMPAVLGPRAMQALEKINATLGLDYGGTDFSLNRAGEILLFEANATMVVPKPDAGAKWEFRNAPVQRIREAVQEMLLGRC